METNRSVFGSRELEFAIFCIENVAARLHVEVKRVCAALTDRTDILKGMKCCIRKARITL